MRSLHPIATKRGQWSLRCLQIHPPPPLLSPHHPGFPSPIRAVQPTTNKTMNEGRERVPPQPPHPAEWVDSGIIMEIQTSLPPNLTAPSSPATRRAQGQGFASTASSVLKVVMVVVMVVQGSVAQDSNIRLRQGNVQGVSMCV